MTKEIAKKVAAALCCFCALTQVSFADVAVEENTQEQVAQTADEVQAQLLAKKAAEANTQQTEETKASE